jgi:hypothetical protein
MVSIASKIKAFRDKLQNRKQQREQTAFQRELKRSERRERREEIKRSLRAKAREKAAPARVEAASTKRQLSKARDDFDPIVVPGGRSAAAAGSKAASVGSKAGQVAIEGSKKAAKVAGDAASEMDVPDDGARPDEYGAAERAGRVAEAGPPVHGVSLSPSGNPYRQERMARGDGRVDEGSMEALVLGGPREGGFNGSMESMAMQAGGEQSDAGNGDDLGVGSMLLAEGADGDERSLAEGPIVDIAPAGGGSK